MKIGFAIQLLFILVDESGSMSDAQSYLSKACNSLLNKNKDQPVLVTVATFGGKAFIYKCKLKPIAAVPKLSFEGDGGSPIWKSIHESLTEIKQELQAFPFAQANFTIVSDMNNEDADSARPYCQRSIEEAQELRWQLTCLCPSGQKGSTAQNAEAISFPANRIMEVS